MNKIISLCISIVVIGSIVVILLSVFLIKDLIVCYDKSVQTFDDLESKFRTYAWDKRKICEMKQNSVIELEQCIGEARVSTKVPAQVYPYVSEFLQNFRPGTQEPEVLEAQHDEDCTGYPETMFAPHT